MAYKVKQFRYYNSLASNSNKNQPAALSLSGDNDTLVNVDHYINGKVFNSCYPVLQLGIQALPGTKFFLNGATEPVIIGLTGIYELELDKGVQITEIKFDSDSMDIIENNSNAVLIVDVLYDSKEV